MNRGRGFSVPQEKGLGQNGDIWVPATPEKPVLQRNNAHSEVPNNLRRGENWPDLIGIYTGVLQNDSGNVLSQKINPNNHIAASYNRMQQCSDPTGILGFKTGMQSHADVALHEAYSRLPQNFSPNGFKGVNALEHNMQQVEVSRLQKFGTLDQKISTSVQNLGEVMPVEVNSLAELLSRESSTGPPLYVMPNRSTYVRTQPTVTCLRSLAESSQMTYAPIGAKLQQNHNFHADHDIGGNNLQGMPNRSRYPVPYWHNDYNLNLPPISETGESSSAARPFSLCPVTPTQEKQSKHYEIIQVPISLADETSSKEMPKKDSIVLSQQTEILEREPSESLFNALDKPTESILTSPAEKSNHEGGNERIDLNKTPQQKTPKRRKHRPKVVVEGKPKRSPNPAATRSKTSDGKPKRNYVRKTGNTTATPPSTEVNSVEASGAEPARKSCKRALNFDLDNEVEKESHGGEFDCQAQNNGRSIFPLNLNLDYNNAECPQVKRPSISAVKEGHGNSCGKGVQQIQTVNSLVQSNHIVQDSMPWGTMTPTPPTPKGHTLNIIARCLNSQISSTNQVGGTYQHISGSIAQLVNQANSCEPSLHSRRQLMLQTVPRLQDSVDVNGEQGSKREYTHNELRQLKTTTLSSSQLCSYAVSETGQLNNESSKLLQNALEKGKMKTLDKFHGSSSSLPSCITTIKDSSAQMEGTRNNNFPAQSTATHQKASLTNLNGKGLSILRNSNDKRNTGGCFLTYQDLMCEFQQKHSLSQLPLCAKQTAPQTSNHTNVQNTNSLYTSLDWNPVSASQRVCTPVPMNEIVVPPDLVTVKRRTPGRPKKVQPGDNFHLQKPKNSRSYERTSKKVQGSQKEQKISFSVDDITDRLKELNINDNGKENIWNERNALVPYKGDGAIVPYEEFDLVKKKQLRPRVDLDPETNRLWNLLMGKEGCEGAETMDTDKRKWWEEERKVFRGRVDSFIARMHLVQGDRRFSKWKGSVIDSVIGVFLTQNVSDHLSSSAFMSLAAKFPLKSATAGRSCFENGGSSSVEQHEVRITFPDGTNCNHKIIKELSYNNGSTTSPQSSEYRTENVTNEKRTFLINDHARKSEEDIISSQSSSESIIFQASEDIRSSSGSNSEAEDGWNFGKNLGYLSVPEQPERIAALQQHQMHFVPGSLPIMRPLIGHQKFENPSNRQNIGLVSSGNGYSYPSMPKFLPHRSSDLQASNNYWTNMLMGQEKWGADFLTLSGKESLSSRASMNYEVSNGKGIEIAQDNTGVHVGTRLATQKGRQQFQLPQANHAIVGRETVNKHRELQTDFPADEPQSRNGQNFGNCEKGKPETFQHDGAFQMELTQSAQASNNQPNDNSKDAGIKLLTNVKEQVHPSGIPSHAENSTTSNARKRKAEKEKAEKFNWDTLRKQVQSNAGTRERNRETMDSMDYEALRNADVREISDTIKERGMNNMLAERIKDFLNRLVRDHGRVDLEWLRDVPPDKAKDYLLSIRGLGLKSVECVRLLTLHHLAFPVDTNVGRIAVRLGWVPLQPLPESLQLHLLELYPVLESIQKYLWPRLCKLDQETLYELHYQMITFGKVFCTKREPNCNACPMRAECRHFASAFASARLALPAPGEKQIVSSAAPITPTKSSDVIVKPMPLPSCEGNVERTIGLTRNSEPFVEEPTTPEAPTEVLERDIEDAFYEDPDEIPVIKLNVEEFTTNLQNIIQEKMELGEGDMSKALVALGPELACIPVPKLKHVSRLRTEHQVYELPDSHPLLKGMDRREPDDPSPYLLAIWTPGETADSVQPPESKCSTQEAGGLCSKSTCFSCSSAREAQAQTVRGTILIPCRTAMQGSFPLNGTYFQVNEVFADHDSSLNPIDVPRSLIWNLPRRTVFFGTSVSTIFKGLSTEGIQYCFWKGFVCVRGFDQKTRAPRPLKARLHLPASKMAKQNE